MFSRFGTPKGLVTDNEPEISSHYFISFREPGILNIEPLIRIFANQMD